jgi:hypothetical protein
MLGTEHGHVIECSYQSCPSQIFLLPFPCARQYSREATMNKAGKCHAGVDLMLFSEESFSLN